MKFKNDKFSDKLFNLDFHEQMAHLGSEIENAIYFKNKGDKESEKNVIFKIIKLLYIMIEDEKNKKYIKELTRLREFLIDYFCFENIYKTSDEFWLKYFDIFKNKRNIKNDK